jgi:ribosomal protein S18 acetylase RimI-like enzyme
MCTCNFLTESDFPRIIRTLDEAFADYYLKSKASCERWLYNRCVKNGVSFDCSIGAFDGDRMVGVTLIGLDDWQGVPAAFDAGTGIVPDYRGRGLARKMFDVAVPRLKERGVRRFLLEVLQVNEPAIKAYRKAGFKITREFDCYELPLSESVTRQTGTLTWEITPISRDQVSTFREQVDWQPSWENSFSSINRIPDEIVAFGAFDNSACVGELVYYPLLNWILSLVVRKEYRRKGVARLLLTHLLGQLDPTIKSVKLINVDHSDEGMKALLQHHGFRPYTSQYEMSLAI